MRHFWLPYTALILGVLFLLFIAVDAAASGQDDLMLGAVVLSCAWVGLVSAFALRVEGEGEDE